ncbi:MAG: 30S ribosomal protein S16 [Bacteroides sp.]
MAVKIRLSRHGRKNRPFYHVVVADSRAPRDGRFIERLGSYDPMTNPATIELNVERALYWLHQGAQPTNTANRILSYKGVLLKKHLEGGVAKGAFSQEEADRRFSAWLNEKEAKIEAKRQELNNKKNETTKSRLEAETKINEARAEAQRKRQAELEAAKKAEAESETAAVENVATEDTAQ